MSLNKHVAHDQKSDAQFPASSTRNSAVTQPSQANLDILLLLPPELALMIYTQNSFADLSSLEKTSKAHARNLLLHVLENPLQLILHSTIKHINRIQTEVPLTEAQTRVIKKAIKNEVIELIKFISTLITIFPEKEALILASIKTLLEKKEEKELEQLSKSQPFARKNAALASKLSTTVAQYYSELHVNMAMHHGDTKFQKARTVGLEPNKGAITMKALNALSSKQPAAISYTPIKTSQELANTHFNAIEYYVRHNIPWEVDQRFIVNVLVQKGALYVEKLAALIAETDYTHIPRTTLISATLQLFGNPLAHLADNDANDAFTNTVEPNPDLKVEKIMTLNYRVLNNHKRTPWNMDKEAELILTRPSLKKLLADAHNEQNLDKYRMPSKIATLKNGLFVYYSGSKANIELINDFIELLDSNQRLKLANNLIAESFREAPLSLLNSAIQKHAADQARNHNRFNNFYKFLRLALNNTNASNDEGEATIEMTRRLELLSPIIETLNERLRNIRIFLLENAGAPCTENPQKELEILTELKEKLYASYAYATENFRVYDLKRLQNILYNVAFKSTYSELAHHLCLAYTRVWGDLPWAVNSKVVDDFVKVITVKKHRRESSSYPEELCEHENSLIAKLPWANSEFIKMLKLGLHSIHKHFKRNTLFATLVNTHIYSKIPRNAITEQNSHGLDVDKIFMKSRPKELVKRCHIDYLKYLLREINGLLRGIRVLDRNPDLVEMRKNLRIAILMKRLHLA